jgi:hypothetical protein
MSDPDILETAPAAASGTLVWLATAAICAIGSISYLATIGAPRIHLHDPDTLFRSWVELGRELGFIGVRFVSLVGLIAAVVCGTPIGRRLAIRGGKLPKGALAWGILLSYLAPWTVALGLWLKR